MDTVIFEIAFRLGKILSLTPSTVKEQKQDFPTKSHSFFVFVLYTTAMVAILSQRQRNEIGFTKIQNFLSVSMDFVLYAHNCFLVTILMMVVQIDQELDQNRAGPKRKTEFFAVGRTTSCVWCQCCSTILHLLQIFRRRAYHIELLDAAAVLLSVFVRCVG
jgi:hypothetical protein